MAPNLVPCVFEKMFLLEIVENNISLGGAINQMPFFQVNVPQKSAPMPLMSGIGPDNF